MRIALLVLAVIVAALSPASAQNAESEIRALSARSGVHVSTLVALAWAVARRGGLAAALATGARAAGREGYPSAASPNHARRAASSPRNTLRSQSTGMPSTR